LNTYFTFERANERWTDFDLHEMYCAGHLFQAAVAHFRATGSERLLDVATRFADHICDTFGPEDGKRRAIDGHEEVEMALVELSRVTGNRRYLEQARFFVDARGYGLLGRPYGQHDPSYSQDHTPFREQDEVVGHAVRALYLYSGAADVYAETGEPELLEALDRLWINMTTRRMYVSGGLGSRYEGEAFGEDYELPNERAYTETCAAIASVMWNWRMLMLDGEARYADLMEHTLYNAVLPGLSLEGRDYFYQNPLADNGAHRRQPWFGCACCPPNVARLLASLPGYFYGISGDTIWVHLYAEGSATAELEDRTVRLAQRTDYPWDGKVEIEVRDEGDFGLMLRVPSWCESGYAVRVNGEAVDVPLSSGSYVEIRRTWRTGDTVGLNLPMPLRLIECHPHVAENFGRVALMRGPLLYCVEQADNPGLDPRDIVLLSDQDPSSRFEPDLLGGVTALTVSAGVLAPDGAWNDRLYRSAPASPDDRKGEPVELTAVPYYAWANREPGAMRVWLHSR
ncbi:MAG: glycoside hydrolase family 127 protein, partial [Rubrobacter sp.]